MGNNNANSCGDRPPVGCSADTESAAGESQVLCLTGSVPMTGVTSALARQGQSHSGQFSRAIFNNSLSDSQRFQFG